MHENLFANPYCTTGLRCICSRIAYWNISWSWKRYASHF